MKLDLRKLYAFKKLEIDSDLDLSFLGLEVREVIKELNTK